MATIKDNDAATSRETGTYNGQYEWLFAEVRDYAESILNRLVREGEAAGSGGAPLDGASFRERSVIARKLGEILGKSRSVDLRARAPNSGPPDLRLPEMPVDPENTYSENAPMSDNISRDEVTARLETIEARMDARVATIQGRIDAFIAESAERDKRLELQFAERDKRLEERDKRIELLAQSATKSAEQASTLKANMWLAALTVVVAVIGTVVAAYYATQSSNIGIAQAIIAGFQQGQSSNSAPPSSEKK